jgi:hypothetical protein
VVRPVQMTGPEDRARLRMSETAEKGIPIDFHPLSFWIVALAAPLRVGRWTVRFLLTLTRLARGPTRTAADRARSARRARW